MDADCKNGRVYADMRILAVFEKSERIRHIGHLDIQRCVQRGLRRSGLPVAYSQGFSPHILVTFASALSTGACGKREIMDVTMAEEVSASEFVARINRAMPPEMQICEARIVDQHHPSLSSALCAAEYDLMIRDKHAGQSLADAVPALLSQSSVSAIRKTKTKITECNIRPLILSLRSEGNHLYAVLTLTEKESCKPQMLIEALQREAGIEEEVRMLITRTALFGKNDQGKLIPLETL